METEIIKIRPGEGPVSEEDEEKLRAAGAILQHYSFEDENGPISKQPSSFSDLSIVVFSSNSQKNSVCLVDKNTNESTDTNITSDSKSLFDKERYGTSAVSYTHLGCDFGGI